MWVRYLIAIIVLTTGSAQAAERIYVNGMVCERLSQTFVMRDSAACGSDRIYCTTPVYCRFIWNLNFGGATVATCRTKEGAANDGGNSAPLIAGPQSCPDLQECAEAEDPEMATEASLSQWRGTDTLPCVTCGVGLFPSDDVKPADHEGEE